MGKSREPSFKKRRFLGLKEDDIKVTGPNGIYALMWRKLRAFTSAEAETRQGNSLKLKKP